MSGNFHAVLEWSPLIKLHVFRQFHNVLKQNVRYGNSNSPQKECKLNSHLRFGVLSHIFSNQLTKLHLKVQRLHAHFQKYLSMLHKFDRYLPILHHQHTAGTNGRSPRQYVLPQSHLQINQHALNLSAALLLMPHISKQNLSIQHQ